MHLASHVAMGPKPIPFFDSDSDAGGRSISSVPNLVSYLKMAFSPSHFHSIERFLTSMQDKHRVEMDQAKGKYKGLEEELQRHKQEIVDLRLCKSSLEDEVKLLKDSSEISAEKMRRLEEEHKSACDSEKRLMDMCGKLQESRGSFLQEKEKRIELLKEENRVLKSEKESAESKLGAFFKLVERVDVIEKETESIQEAMSSAKKSGNQRILVGREATFDLPSQSNDWLQSPVGVQFAGIKALSEHQPAPKHVIEIVDSESDDDAIIGCNGKQESVIGGQDPTRQHKAEAVRDLLHESSGGSSVSCSVSIASQGNNVSCSQNRNQVSPAAENIKAEPKSLTSPLELLRESPHSVTKDKINLVLNSSKLGGQAVKGDDDSIAGCKRKRESAIGGHSPARQHKAEAVNNWFHKSNGGTSVSYSLSTASEGENVISSQNRYKVRHAAEKIKAEPNSLTKSLYSGNKDKNNLVLNSSNLGAQAIKVCRDWGSELDMQFAFYESSEHCMEAVCALYRQHILGNKAVKEEDDKLDKLKLSGSDLALFLLDGDPQGKLKKSAEDLSSEGLDICRSLAIRYKQELYDIYWRQKDPFFSP